MVEPRDMTRAELEDEVLALRYKFEELVTAPADWIDGIRMSRMERRLLKFMASNLGRKCTKTTLHECMYPSYPATEPTIVEVYMCRIRTRIADTNYEIRTIWGEGYSLISKG